MAHPLPLQKSSIRKGWSEEGHTSPLFLFSPSDGLGSGSAMQTISAIRVAHCSVSGRGINTGGLTSSSSAPKGCVPALVDEKDQTDDDAGVLLLARKQRTKDVRERFMFSSHLSDHIHQSSSLFSTERAGRCRWTSYVGCLFRRLRMLEHPAQFCVRQFLLGWTICSHSSLKSA